MWVDTHCHLTYEETPEDVVGVIDRARTAGVGAFMSIGCRLDDIPALEILAANYQDIFFSVGIHPHEAEETLGKVSLAALRSILEEKLAHAKMLGIGETGLDYFYDHSPREIQKDVFRLQINLAKDHDLPLIIHTRDADDDTLSILKEEAGPHVKGVLHCFSGSRRLFEEGVGLGLYVSASGIVTFNKAADLREVFKDVPLDRLLLETDAPYLAPTPHRGKRNESAYMIHTAKVIADLKEISLEALQAQTTKNFLTLFSKAAPYFQDAA
ncbi:MAG: TatD family hydrolase [Alphaproteobacteria bacterium]|nr:TatD family hydrolase [Alphaproteobacteria bacterium]